MPTETLTRNARPAAAAAPELGSRQDEALRALARRHLEYVRKFKLYAAVHVLTMLVLVPVWIVTQYETQGGWPKHLSSRSR